MQDNTDAGEEERDECDAMQDEVDLNEYEHDTEQVFLSLYDGTVSLHDLLPMWFNRSMGLNFVEHSLEVFG